jgi:hypothetical protein
VFQSTLSRIFTKLPIQTNIPSIVYNLPLILSDYTVCLTFLAGDFDSDLVVVTIPAGQTTATIMIALMDDSVIENTEEFTLTLINPSMGNVDPNAGSATAMILDNDGRTFG